MIVDPDFFDHWKTLLLIESLDNDQAAPLYVLRLWAHCQNRRRCVFDSLSDRALKALCRYPGHPKKLVAGLVESGFVTLSDCGQLQVNGWEEYNAKLIANWENGKKGGRPKKESKNPAEAQMEPNGNPTETQVKPNGNPNGTHSEPIRVDRSRGEKKNLREREGRPLGDAPFIPEEMQTQEFLKAWDDWKGAYFREKGKHLDPIRQQHILQDLTRRGPEKAVKDISFSLRNGWHTRIADSDGEKRDGRRKKKYADFDELLGSEK